MKTAIYTTSSAPMVELADTPVLGTGLARGTSSSLVRRTNKTSLATLLDYKFVAQGVALKTECCKVGKGSIGNSRFWDIG